MTRVLVIGYAPEATDYSDTTIPQGFDEKTLAAALEEDQQNLFDRGWEAEHLLIQGGNSLRQSILDRLSTKPYDCIVIGAGVRMTSKHIRDFEVVVASVREAAPRTPIAFNTGPSSSADAAARWLTAS